MTKINVPVAHKFLISPIPEARLKALIKKSDKLTIGLLITS
jgi:hypothetical protein